MNIIYMHKHLQFMEENSLNFDNISIINQSPHMNLFWKPTCHPLFTQLFVGIYPAVSF